MRAGATDAVTSVLDAVAAVLAGAGVDGCHRLCGALSGGVDSVVLLDALDALQPRFGFVLEAAHVHHGLSPAAGDWQDFCAEFCQRRSIHLHVFKVDVPRNHPGGLEEAARIARHAVLSGVACDWLALGHHRDDQAETVLFRLLRGAGVQGAAAMASIEAARLGLVGQTGAQGRLRPLLELGREAILAFARERGLSWVDDASNADPRFARNDLRHRVLPGIESRFPGARAALARAAAHFREAAGLLDELAEADALACIDGNAETGKAYVFKRKSLLNLSPARLGNLLRWELRRQGGMPPSSARLAETIRQLRAARGPLLLPLGGDFACRACRGQVWLQFFSTFSN